jgi:hypothetical protein
MSDMDFIQSLGANIGQVLGSEIKTKAYYNSADGKMYEDSSFTTEKTITATMCVDIATSKVYVKNSAGNWGLLTNKPEVEELIAVAVADNDKLKLIISSTEPSTTGLKKGIYWLESNATTPPVVFPLSVKKFNGTAWATTTTNYTPNLADMCFVLNNENTEWIYTTENWNRIDFTQEGDNKTINKNSAGKLQTIIKVAYNSTSKSVELQDNDNSKLSEITNANLVNALQEELDKKQNVMQFTTMPTASADYNNKIVQFVGTTTLNYTQGYFYKCVEDDTQTPSTYSWEQQTTQKDMDVDNSTIQLNGSNQLEVKDGGISYAKINSNNISQGIPDSNPSSTKFTTEADVKTYADTKIAKANLKTSMSGTPSDDNVLSEKFVDTTYQTKANLVTSFQGTPDDTHYASEKLTKDNLDLKVNITDIVDNLTSTTTNKPLSANQGKVLQDNKLSNTLTTEQATALRTAITNGMYPTE